MARLKQDVSNSTIAVLLVLTILVSVVGTWTVLDKTKDKLGNESGDAITGNVVADIDADWEDPEDWEEDEEFESEEDFEDEDWEDGE